MKYSLFLILIAFLCYLVGNFNWALLISKFKKTDIRKMGSGNPGTLNMSRNFGIKIGFLTLFLDMLKGAVPAIVCFFIFKGALFNETVFPISDFIIYFCGLFVIIGHVFPVFMHFRGGKGIASTIGLFMACESLHGFPYFIIAICALVLAFIFVYFTEFGAMGSFIAITPPAVSGIIYNLVNYGNLDGKTTVYLIITNILVLSIILLTWCAHHKNIKRMLNGTEHPTSIKSMIKRAKEKNLQKQNAN